MRLNAEDTMAMIIDFQEKLMPVIAHNEALEKRTNILIQGLKTLEIPMIVTQQYTKGMGMTIPSILASLESDTYFDKITFSCYDDEAIREAVEAQSRKIVLVCGVESHICVLQTCIDLKEAGYTPVLVVDCIGSRNDSDKEVALVRAQQEGVFLTTTEAVLFELTRKAGNAQFKTISKLIK